MQAWFRGSAGGQPETGRRGTLVAVDSLALLCLWLFLDGATFAVVTTPLLLLYAPRFEPWQVAVAGGVASAAGSLVQLLGFRWILGRDWPWLRRWLPAREKVDALRAQHASASFVAIVIARATPLPDAPIKLAAAVLRYPPALYFLAVVLGALPYYYALAWIGHEFRLPAWAIAGVAAAFVLALVIDRLRPRRSDAGA
jgi:uncharacterized membrane protein YdjX (TVP38/TMEM64 family)